MKEVKLEMSMNQESELDLDFTGTDRSLVIMLVTAMDANENIRNGFYTAVKMAKSLDKMDLREKQS